MSYTWDGGNSEPPTTLARNHRVVDSKAMNPFDPSRSLTYFYGGMRDAEQGDEDKDREPRS